MLTSSVLPFICIFSCFLSLPAASFTRVVSMVTGEEAAPLGCLSGLELRRDPDTQSGLRSPAATDKGDLEIDVSAAAVPTVLQLWTDRRANECERPPSTRRIHPPPKKNDMLPTFLESCICFHFTALRDRESKPRLSHRSKGTNPNLRLSDAASQLRWPAHRRRRLSAAAFLFCSLLQKTVRFC